MSFYRFGNCKIKLAVLLLCAAASAASAAKGQDLYPRIHKIIQAAETTSANIRAFDDRSLPAEWAGRLYARAGYVQDAERAFSRSSGVVSFVLLKAYVLYGDGAAADRLLTRIADPYKRGQADLVVADVFWRMGQLERAETYAKEAKKSAERLSDPVRRANLLQLANQDAEYMTGPAPNSLSPSPSPPVATEQTKSPFTMFPITAGGFADETQAQIESDAKVNGALMEEIYKRVMARDRQGLERLRDAARTPFQKTLLIASIEHLFIQAHQPQMAEQLAATIPEADDECTLAKAEALRSVAAEWLRAEAIDHANTAFARAVGLAQSANKLPIGEVAVLASIAEAQATGRLTATSHETLESAKRIAAQLPLPPAVISGGGRPRPMSHYRPEAYREILAVAVRHDLGTAREIANLWRTADRNADSYIMRAWFQAGEADEAIAFARSIENTAERAKMEFWLAQLMLDDAGAPNI